MACVCKNNKEIPSDMILGNLLYYSLVDMKMSETDLENIFVANSIPEKYIRKIGKADAFRRATASIKNDTFAIVGQNGEVVKAKVEVDEVNSDINGVKRIMGIKAVNNLHESINYDAVATFEFDRKTEMMSYNLTTTNPLIQQYVQQYCMEVSNKYTEWSQYHNKDTIRNTVLRIVNDTHPVCLTSTGLCKFVPRTQSSLLYSLKDALNEMSSFAVEQGRENSMEIIPLINTEEEQSLIKDASQKEIQEDLYNFTQELKELLQNKQTLSTKSVNSYLLKFKDMYDKITDYENLLGNYMDVIKQQLKASIQLVNSNQNKSFDTDEYEEERVANEE